MTNVVLCSRHPITIAGFRAIIEASEDFSLSVCPEVGMLVQRVQENDVHIVLADLACGINLGVLTELRAAAPAAALVLWVENVTTEFISQAIRLGVLGVLRKDAEVELSLQCLRQVAAGELWVEKDLSNKLLRIRNVKLTRRQRQLAAMLAQGLKNKEMAFRLGLSEGTVKVYLSRLYEKVGASDRLELALFALKNLAVDQPTASENLASPDDSSTAMYMMPMVVSVGPSAAFVQ
jgi:DNA-binding NarL/FixJ family response regulator